MFTKKKWTRYKYKIFCSIQIYILFYTTVIKRNLLLTEKEFLEKKNARNHDGYYGDCSLQKQSNVKRQDLSIKPKTCLKSRSKFSALIKILWNWINKRFSLFVAEFLFNLQFSVFYFVHHCLSFVCLLSNLVSVYLQLLIIPFISSNFSYTDCIGYHI